MSLLPMSDSLALCIVVVLALPLLSFLISSVWKNERLAGAMGTVAVLLSFLFAAQLSISKPTEASLLSVPWLILGEREISVGFLLDNLSALMLLLVSFISFLVHLFSIAYLRGKLAQSRYFAHLGLFTFAMLGLVISSDLVQLFVFWEVVGLCSYLLIGFYRNRKTAARASKKAFLINRIADMGFLFGLMVCFGILGGTQINYLSNGTFPQGADSPWVLLAGIGFLIAALGKSAQFPFHLWLPDAMEGPTPVSALIHAATMVAAGIFLLARLYLFLDLSILEAMAIIGAITAAIGAFAAIAQHDIKKVLAYSTISQLGFMMVGLGTGAYGSAIFHLVTHAFFKAGLFLSTGAVIMAIQKADSQHHIDAQDMRLMGGLRKKLPVTFVCHLIFAAALAGIPLFSGFLSKDPIIVQAFGWAKMQSVAGNSVLYIVPLLTFLAAFLTAIYIARQVYLVYFGNNRLTSAPNREFAAIYDRIHLRSALTGAPLVMLAAMSTFLFFTLNPFSGELSWTVSFIDQGMTAHILDRFSQANPLSTSALSEFLSSGHTWVSIGTVLLAILGIFIGFRLNSENMIFGKPLARFSFKALYLDSFYAPLAVPATMRLSQLSRQVDSRLIDGFIDNFARATVVGGHVLHWMDRVLVDGAVNSLVLGVRTVGQVARGGKTGKVQVYLAIAVLMSLLLITAFAIVLKS